MTYTVVKGDTLGKIADKYKVTVAQILAANPDIKDPNVIHVGQVIRIPSGSTADVAQLLRQALSDVEALPSVKALMEVI